MIVILNGVMILAFFFFFFFFNKEQLSFLIHTTLSGVSWQIRQAAKALPRNCAQN